MSGAGAPHRHDPDDDIDDPRDVRDDPNWSLTVGMAAVVVVALVVGVVALLDTPQGRVRSAERAAAGVATTVVATTADRPTTTAPAVTTTARPTTTRATTTTARPTTTRATTTAVPSTTTTTPPPTTAPPTTPNGPSLLPDGWYSVVAADAAFRAELPSSPRVTTPLVQGPTGTVPRVEYNAPGPAGSVVSVTSVPAPLDGRTADELLDGAAGQIRRDVGGILHLGDRSIVDGAPARRFVVDVRGGRILGMVVHRGATLHLVSVFDPAGAGPGPAAAFERVASTFHLL